MTSIMAATGYFNRLATLPTQKLPGAARFGAFAVALARELGFASLVIKPPSTGFSFYNHYQYLSCQSEVWHHCQIMPARMRQASSIARAVIRMPTVRQLPWMANAAHRFDPAGRLRFQQPFRRRQGLP
jgi:hypothetical protein